MDKTAAHIECDGVTKSYLQKGKVVPVLDGLSFGVRERELLVVLGPGQSGKTTLLRLMAGLERPESGCIRMHGTPVTGPSNDKGLVFQSYMLFPWLTVLGNVEIGLDIQGRQTGANRGRCGKRPAPIWTWSACRGLRTTTRTSFPEA
jgi:NitT/TauT family transport system ATP-binding protein/sulfonate transport system ATP-binding protein